VPEELERIVTPVPGPQTAALISRLRAHESRNVTYVANDYPVFWESASGALVVDVDGNRYIDLTAAFGVANAGHANPHVAAAIADQASRLMHGMGDVFPNDVRVRLFEALMRRLPRGLEVVFPATTGSEAVEAALKTAVLATGKSHFAAFEGAYHGLALGTLPLCGIDRFVRPFANALGPPAVRIPYPDANEIDVEAALERTRSVLRGTDDVAAIVIEPIAGRGGCVVPPPGYLRGIRELCNEIGALMIADEIFTGFGRTGTWFAVDADGVTPDIICIGKAMASGFPMSAAVGTRRVMDAWPVSAGEALHTSTYLGNPMGCAAALATLHELENHDLPGRAARLGAWLQLRLEALRALPAVADIRGRGLLWGVALRDARQADAAVKRALAQGVLLLQSGPSGATLSITPPLVIGEGQLARAIDLVEDVIRRLES
jgi:4-aminobutyrate aminotransferase-like enzyme